MASNNSTLQIEVVSQGIADTVRKLDLLGNAAGRNEGKVKLLTDSLKNLMTAQNSAASAAAQHANLMSAIAQSMGLVSAAATKTAAQVSALTANLNQLNGASNNATAAMQRKSAAGHVLNATLRAMTTAALAYMGVNFVKGIVEAADGWKMMQARLKLATGSMEEAKTVQADLFATAQRLRAPLEDVGRLYTRMAIPMQRMGKDAKQTAEQVEFVALALKLNGATAAEASSVMLQYSQSVNAGRLNGAEFNAVAEGAPGILRAIEAELKATGKWSEYSGKTLKQMGADGEITFELLNAASQRALPQMRKDFESLPLTVDGALQRVKNAWFKAMGEMGESADVGVKLAKAIAVLEENIPKIRDALAGTFLFLHDNFGRIAIAIEALLAIKLVMWAGSVSWALYATAAAAAAAASGLSVAQGAIMAFGRAAALLSGPLGIIVALIGVGAVQAYKAFSDMAPKAEKVVTDSTKINTANRIEMVQKEIDKLTERNNLSSKNLPAVDSNGISDAAIAQLKRVNSFRERLSKESNPINKSMLQIDIDFEQKQFEGLVALEAKAKGLRADAAEDIRKEQLRGVRDKLGLKSETNAAKAARLIDEAKKDLAQYGGVLSEAEQMAIRLKVLGENLGVKPAARDSYKERTASLRAHREELELNLLVGEKASTAEKTRAAMAAGADKDYNTWSVKQRAEIDLMVEGDIAMERKIELRDRLNKANIDAASEDDKHTKKMQAGVVTINAEIDRIRAQTAALTESKTAVKEHAAAKLEADAASAEAMAIRQMDKSGNMQQYELYMAEARALRELAGANRELGETKDSAEAGKALDKLLDPSKAFAFGDALASAFGKAGAGIGGMTKALDKYGHEQKEVSKVRKALLETTDDKVRQDRLSALDKKEAKSKLRAYGDIAGAAKGFFSEHTAGYKIMAATEKAFRIVELADTIKNTAMKVWGSLTVAGAKTAETTALVANAGVDTATTGVSVGNSFTRAAASTVAGVAKAFEQMGVWGFVGAAGIIAFMAAMGVGGGGGGGGAISSADRQKRQGTGTVLGDDEAKSASLANSLEALRSNSNIGLVHTSNMLASLRNIEASMKGLSASIARVNGMTTGKNFGIQEGTTGGGFLSSVFGGKTTTSIADTGLVLNGTAGDFAGGRGARQYVDVNYQKSGGWFSKAKSWTQRNYMAADSEVTKTIGRIFGDINSTIVDAATTLGRNGDMVRAQLEAFVINTEISFKGLKGDELQQALNDVFSGAADGMARSVFPGLEAFQRGGEGYYETIIRVATGTEQAMDALKNFGVGMVDIDTLTNKTGDIGLELVRESIVAKEAGTSMAEIMRLMGGSMSDLISGYRTLLSLQDTMRASGLGGSVSMATIRGAGGIAELDSSMQDFIEGFYSGAEKQVIGVSKLRAEFGRLGVTMPTTKDGFKNLVTELMNGGEVSQELAGRILNMSGAFADAFDEVQQTLNDNVENARDALREAYDKESSALENVRDKMKGFTESLTAFRAGLITGDMSTKSLAEKYATAKAQHDDISVKALSGDEAAIAGYEKAASELLKFSRDINASGAGYTTDYDRVLAETEALRAFTADQVDIATASLAALNEQVKGLLDINKSVLSVTDAIIALHAAMAAVAAGTTVDGSHAGGLSNVPFDGYIAELHKGEAVLTASENNDYRASFGMASVKADDGTAAELKALREELKQLREEQRNQTASLIASNYDANERNAQVVVAGTKGAMEDASYLERTKTGLV